MMKMAPKMAKYGKKSAIFLGDVIGYAGHFTFSNQATFLLQNVLSQQKLLIFKLKYLVIEPYQDPIN